VRVCGLNWSRVECETSVESNARSLPSRRVGSIPMIFTIHGENSLDLSPPFAGFNKRR
jgi:hypothetical protein